MRTLVSDRLNKARAYLRFCADVPRFLGSTTSYEEARPTIARPLESRGANFL